MAYDVRDALWRLDTPTDAQFAGSWDQVSGHQAALYSSSPGGVSVDNAGRFYAGKGVAPGKLVVGPSAFRFRTDPLAEYRYATVRAGVREYGRHWTPIPRYVPWLLASPADPQAWERGHGKPACGTTRSCLNPEHRNTMILSSAHRTATTRMSLSARAGRFGLIHRSKKLLITYDTPQITHQKAEYIRNNGLGGAMWWELDADKARGSGSLVETARATMGELEYRENELLYPGSSTSMTA